MVGDQNWSNTSSGTFNYEYFPHTAIPNDTSKKEKNKFIHPQLVQQRKNSIGNRLKCWKRHHPKLITNKFAGCSNLISDSWKLWINLLGKRNSKCHGLKKITGIFKDLIKWWRAKTELKAKVTFSQSYFMLDWTIPHWSKDPSLMTISDDWDDIHPGTDLRVSDKHIQVCRGSIQTGVDTSSSS